jgi:hypothetical protein
VKHAWNVSFEERRGEGVSVVRIAGEVEPPQRRQRIARSTFGEKLRLHLRQGMNARKLDYWGYIRTVLGEVGVGDAGGSRQGRRREQRFAGHVAARGVCVAAKKELFQRARMVTFAPDAVASEFLGSVSAKLMVRKF